MATGEFPWLAPVAEGEVRGAAHVAKQHVATGRATSADTLV